MLRNHWRATLLVVVVVALMVGPAVYLVRPQPTSTGAELSIGDHREYEEGASAFRAGVSAEANPLRGYGGSLWLRGWIDAKKQAEGAK